MNSSLLAETTQLLVFAQVRDILDAMDPSNAGFETPAGGNVDRHTYQKLGYERVWRGVYQQSEAPDGDQWAARRTAWRHKVRAAMALYAHLQPVLYGPTALQALLVALPSSVEDWQRVHILIPDGRERPRRAGVIAHRSKHPVQPWRMFSGIPVLHPVDHWLQLPGATLDEMVQIGDGFLRRRNPLLSLDNLEVRLTQLSSARRSPLARKAMKDVRANTDSLYETITRLVLVRAGLPVPEVNYPAWCPLADTTYHVDMGYPDSKIAIEYDGLVHVQDGLQMEIDADRRRNLQDAGWLLIPVTASQLRHPEIIIHSVETAFMLRAQRGDLAA